MTVWRLEVLRLIRTKRWMPIVGVLLISGVLSPLTARYFTDFLESFGPKDIQVTAAAATPAEGMREYVGNALQLGILSLVLVSAWSISVDGNREIAVFLRTRVRSMREVVIPKYVVVSSLAAVSFAAGSAIAWVETGALLGSLPVGRTLIGIGTGTLLEFFVVAVVVYAAGRTTNYIQAAVLTVAVIFVMPTLEHVDALRSWLPSRLASNLLELDRSRSAVEYLKPVAVTLVAIPALIAAGIRGMDRRET